MDSDQLPEPVRLVTEAVRQLVEDGDRDQARATLDRIDEDALLRERKAALLAVIHIPGKTALPSHAIRRAEALKVHERNRGWEIASWELTSKDAAARAADLDGLGADDSRRGAYPSDTHGGRHGYHVKTLKTAAPQIYATHDGRWRMYDSSKHPDSPHRNSGKPWVLERRGDTERQQPQLGLIPFPGHRTLARVPSH